MSLSGYEWIDGFLFVANHLILDLLNTKPVLQVPLRKSFGRACSRKMVDCFRNGEFRKDESRYARLAQSTQAAAFLDQLVAFRERLRESVVRIEAPDRSRRMPSSLN